MRVKHRTKLRQVDLRKTHHAFFCERLQIKEHLSQYVKFIWGLLKNLREINKLLSKEQTNSERSLYTSYLFW